MNEKAPDFIIQKVRIIDLNPKTKKSLLLTYKNSQLLFVYLSSKIFCKVFCNSTSFISSKFNFKLRTHSTESFPVVNYFQLRQGS